MTGYSTTETIADKVDPARAAALLTVLGFEPTVDVGMPLPPFAHHAFFWSPEPEDRLSADGLPVEGGLMPETGLPVRMLAGGRLRAHAPFRAGIAAERHSRLAGMTRKEGRSGRLVFVTIRHEVRQRGQLVLTEDQDIVCREARALDGEFPAASEPPDERRAFRSSAVTLFRHSALTFNAHRIHYDAEYCRSEGYPGIVVSGPLMAASLGAMALDRGQVTGFDYRISAPLFLGDVAWLCRAGNKYWVEGPGRRLCLSATAETG